MEPSGQKKKKRTSEEGEQQPIYIEDFANDLEAKLLSDESHDEEEEVLIKREPVTGMTGDARQSKEAELPRKTKKRKSQEIGDEMEGIM